MKLDFRTHLVQCFPVKHLNQLCEHYAIGGRPYAVLLILIQSIITTWRPHDLVKRKCHVGHALCAPYMRYCLAVPLLKTVWDSVIL